MFDTKQVAHENREMKSPVSKMSAAEKKEKHNV